MSNLQTIKQRFGIIGNDPKLNLAIEKASQVAPTDISVLVSGESGVGKEFFPKIIHSLSTRKHNHYIAVNCGAIPEGTIDSELFGHEKGAFTGATQTRKGYFEVADGGTIFLDEVGELPLHTQVRLLRLLENGEFIKVGSSQIQKTDVRIIAATNVRMQKAIGEGKFREDLYYRLNTVEIKVPALRERKEDIPLLYKKFAINISEKYPMPAIDLEPEALLYLKNQTWPGNIRQLKNLVEEISVIESDRIISLETIKKYISPENTLPIIRASEKNSGSNDFASEREILYKILFDLKKEVNELKALTVQVLNNRETAFNTGSNEQKLAEKLLQTYPTEDASEKIISLSTDLLDTPTNSFEDTQELSDTYIDVTAVNQESLSLHDNELEMIRKALEKHGGKRKSAADELGISERTLYRKIKQYKLQ